MRAEIKTVAIHQLSRAREALAEGEHLLAKGTIMGVVNRLDSAAFYAATALLAMKEADSSRHSGVISLFQKHFVATGQISVERAKALPRAFENRQKSDYGDFATVTPKEAETVKQEVHAFLEERAGLLNRLTAE